MSRLLDWLNEVRKRLSGLGGSIPAAAFVPGDVVIDRYSGKRKAVEYVDGNRAAVAWFEGRTLKRGLLLTRNLTLAA